jgi:hypothetical protein
MIGGLAVAMVISGVGATMFGYYYRKPFFHHSSAQY